MAETGEWNSGHFIFIVGGIKCVKNLTLHSASVLSISAGDHWLGIGAADNSMSLFHRPQERFGSFSNTGSKVAGWQLYRTPQKTSAVVIHLIALFNSFLPSMFAILINERLVLISIAVIA